MRLFSRIKKISLKIAVTVAAIILSAVMAIGLYGCSNNKADIPIEDEKDVNVRDPAAAEEDMNEGAGNQQIPPAAETPTAPSAPESPQRQTDTLVAATTDGLKVRSGPSTSYRVLGSMDKGDMLAYESVSSGWYKVRYANGYGYVSSAYLKKREFDKGSATVEKVIDEGKKLLGTPYVFGAQRYHWGNGVKNTAFTVKEFDCSSLMQYIFKLGANVNLDTTSRSQSVQGKAVALSDIRRGDLLFFTNDSRRNKSGIERIGHVALYLGDNYILHTASDFAVIEEISAKRQSYFVCARRVIA